MGKTGLRYVLLLHVSCSHTYLVTLAPKSHAVVKERLVTVARLIGVDLAVMPWHEPRAHHLDYIKGRLAKEDAGTGKTRAPATINLTLAAQRGVLRQARNQNLLSDEEYRRVTEVKGVRFPATGLAVDGGELKALVEVCYRDPRPAGARDAAILAVLYIIGPVLRVRPRVAPVTLGHRGGVRRTKVVGLALSDYTADPPTLRIRHGKGDKERLAPLTASAGAALAA